MPKVFQPNDWIDGNKGIGQVLFTVNFIVEPFNFKAIEDGKKIGEPHYDLIVYKILCDYQGKIRKKNFIMAANSVLCNKVTSESKLLINQIKKNEPIFFKKFIDYKLIDKDAIGDVVNLYYQVKKGVDINKALEFIETIIIDSENMKTFDELWDILKEMGSFIKDQNTYNIEPNILQLQLYNQNFKLNTQKQRLFSRLTCINT